VSKFDCVDMIFDGFYKKNYIKVECKNLFVIFAYHNKL
jgi:hypothetical protein